MGINKFIVIEGLDGSGKSTVTQLLKQRFEVAGQPCHATFEPTNNPIGQLIRKMLSGDIPMENETAALLFAADRYEHLTKEIIPTLEHSHVVCDRYYYSNMAYQGLDLDTLQRVIYYNQAAMKILKPDAVFFLDISPVECMRRVTARGNKASIYETLPELELRHSRFMEAHTQLPGNIIKIGNDSDTLQEIVQKIWSICDELFCS